MDTQNEPDRLAPLAPYPAPSACGAGGPPHEEFSPLEPNRLGERSTAINDSESWGSMQVQSPSSYTSKGFLGSLFDVNFSSLIVTRVIKAVYVIAIILIGIEAIGLLILAVAMKSPGEITAALVIIPIVSLLTLIWVRILLELVIIIFRIGEDVRHISLFAGLRGRPEEQGVVTTAAFASKLDTAERAHVGQLSHTVPTSTEEAQVSPGPTHVEETPRSDQPVAGWYPDPQFEGYLRVWDGESWTDQRRPWNPKS